MIRIKCIGFSVTGYGDTSYPSALAKKLNARSNNYLVSCVSLGGLSIDGMPFLIRELVKPSEVDIVVLEFATSWLSLQQADVSRAVDFLTPVLLYLESVCGTIIFLNLYRRDIIDRDLVVCAIELLAADKHIVVDLKKYYRDMLLRDGIDQTTDGVHPMPEAIFHIGDVLGEKILNLELCDGNFHEPAYIDRFLWLPDVFDGRTTRFDNRHGYSANAGLLRAGECVDFSVPEGFEIFGVFFAMGPDTSFANFHFDSDVVRIDMYDEMSFYRRLSYRHFGKRTPKNIKIMQSEEKVSVKLVREPWESVEQLKCYFIGFAVVRHLIL